MAQTAKSVTVSVMVNGVDAVVALARLEYWTSSSRISGSPGTPRRPPTRRPSTPTAGPQRMGAPGYPWGGIPG